MILEALLREAEGEEDKTDEEKPEEEASSDEPAEGGDTAKTGAESTDDSGEDAPAAEASDEGGDESEKDKEEKEYDESIASVIPAVDRELQDVLTDIEGAAIEKAAAAEKFAQKSNEALRHQFIRFLFEAEEPTPALDVDTYAAEVARLISNYMNLIDMEKVIFDKAYKFLSDKYGDDTADSFKDILDKKFDLNFDQTVDIEKAQPGYDVYAVGAKGASQA
jgi:hypothetical protein